MTTTESKRRSIKLPVWQWDAILGHAGRLGCNSSKGIKKGQPSVSRLLSDLAHGHLVVKRAVIMEDADH